MTPSDYQPPGFVSSEDDELGHVKDAVNIAVGDVATVRDYECAPHVCIPQLT